jgi:hypothetical protein
LPPYYDPQYDCLMEILRFDSRAPNARYRGLVEQLHGKLLETPVIARPYWPPMRSRGFSPQMLPSTQRSAPELAA